MDLPCLSQVSNGMKFHCLAESVSDYHYDAISSWLSRWPFPVGKRQASVTTTILTTDRFVEKPRDYRKVLTGESTLIVSTDNDLFNLLKSARAKQSNVRPWRAQMTLAGVLLISQNQRACVASLTLQGTSTAVHWRPFAGGQRHHGKRVS